MSSSEWVWIGLVIIQMIGLGIVLATLGFGYYEATREKTGLIKVLESDHRIDWLALGMIIFTIGLLPGEAHWLQKSASVGIALFLGWIAWQSK